MLPVIVDFRVICGSSRDYDRAIWHGELSAIPNRGDVISIDGSPFVVVEIGWAASSSDNNTFCYIRVSNLFVHTDAVCDIDRYKIQKVK